MKPKPTEIQSLHVTSKIENRYANTLVTSRVVNPAHIAQEVNFEVVIPQTAFITGFVMEIGGKLYEAYVAEKAKAEKIYIKAVEQGLSAAHVHAVARDSERFSVSVNLEPRSRITFNLTYEEFLHRELGVYRHVININPGQAMFRYTLQALRSGLTAKKSVPLWTASTLLQNPREIVINCRHICTVSTGDFEIVPEIKVDVHIKESKDLLSVFAHEIQSSDQVGVRSIENPNSRFQWITSNEALIQMEAGVQEQRRLQKRDNSDGVSGQYVIEYDVERDQAGNELIVNDGYFVHFFAPKIDNPLPRHVIFVLDVSSSMEGRKIEQVKEAMITIIDELNDNDVFNIIKFSRFTTITNLDNINMSNISPYPANAFYKGKAKEVLQNIQADGSTDMDEALSAAFLVATVEIDMISMDLNRTKKFQQPMIIFLTDGTPNEGETRLDVIQSNVLEHNTKVKASIFSLGFGFDVDFKFLKELSLNNKGFARRIYEAADSSIQLQLFYKGISSLGLSNIRFKYPKAQVKKATVTNQRFENYFSGSELVSAGKYTELLKSYKIKATSVTGPKVLNFSIQNNATKMTHGSLERLWAHLSIQNYLEQDARLKVQRGKRPLLDSPNSPRNKALQLALKYSFVCKLTSLVVVKPDSQAPLPAPEDSEYINPCVPSPCGPFSQCRVVEGSPSCSCQPTYIGAPPQCHLDLDTCIGFCGVGAFCNVINNNPICSCPPGMTGDAFAYCHPNPQDAPFAPEHEQSAPVLPMEGEEQLEEVTDGIGEMIHFEITEGTDQTFPWIKDSLDADTILVNTTTGRIRLNFAYPENASYDVPCSVGNETALCTPLLSCAITGVVVSFDEYVHGYRCELPDNLAGVCCHGPRKEAGNQVETTTKAPCTTTITSSSQG